MCIINSAEVSYFADVTDHCLTITVEGNQCWIQENGDVSLSFVMSAFTILILRAGKQYYWPQLSLMC